MEQNYWNTVRAARVSRRKVLRTAGIGAAGLAGAALIGCGGDDDAAPTSAPGTGGGQSTAAPDPNAGDGPQSGGTLRLHNLGDVESFYMTNTPQLSGASQMAYAMSRLLMPAPGEGATSGGELIGDLAESVEAPDSQTYIFNLRQGVTWDDRAPTSGREFVAEDVVQSFDRAAETARARSAISHAASPDAPITSMTALDDHTVEMKLAFPDVLILQLVANMNPMTIYPMEAHAGEYDPVQEMRGTGPFRMVDYRQGVMMRFERNEKWHLGPERPYVDAVELSIIPETAQVESQFRAGNLHFSTGAIADQPQVVKEVPGTSIAVFPPPGNGPQLNFNWTPESGMHDVRVRRALSMVIDRDAFIDVIYEPNRFAEVGVELNRYWNTPLPAAFGDWWLDPKGDNFGPAAAFLHHNIAEARQLLDAAGYDSSNPYEYELIFPGNRHDARRTRQAETLQAMSAEAGINMILNSTDYNTGWLDIYSPSRGYWPRGAEQNRPMDGVLYRPNSSQADASHWFTIYYNPNGSNTVTGQEFPEAWSKVEALKGMQDDQERREAVHDIQRYSMDNMISIPVDARPDFTDVYWDGVRGYGHYAPWPGATGGYGRAAEVFTRYWLDDSARRT